MVARLLWEQDVAGSNPVIPTKKEEIALAVIFSFLLWYVDSKLFCVANAGSHTPLVDRQACLSGAEREYHAVKRSYPVIPTKKEEIALAVIFSFLL